MIGWNQLLITHYALLCRYLDASCSIRFFKMTIYNLLANYNNVHEIVNMLIDPSIDKLTTCNVIGPQLG